MRGILQARHEAVTALDDKATKGLREARQLPTRVATCSRLMGLTTNEFSEFLVGNGSFSITDVFPYPYSAGFSERQGARHSAASQGSVT